MYVCVHAYMYIYIYIYIYKHIVGVSVYKKHMDISNTHTEQINGDGCSNFCSIEGGWVCVSRYMPEIIVNPDRTYRTKDGADSVCSPNYVCGDGVVSPSVGEECDDTNFRAGNHVLVCMYERRGPCVCVYV